MKRRSFLLFLAALWGIPLISLAVFVAWMILTLGPMEMPPPPTKFEEISMETSTELVHAGLAAALRKKWGIHLEETDRIVRATWNSANADVYYLLAPGEEFDYDAFREALMGDIRLRSWAVSEYYVDDDDDLGEKGSGELSWWNPPSLKGPDVIQIMAGKPEGPNTTEWYFAISREDGLIYIARKGTEAVRMD